MSLVCCYLSFKYFSKLLYFHMCHLYIVMPYLYINYHQLWSLWWWGLILGLVPKPTLLDVSLADGHSRLAAQPLIFTHSPRLCSNSAEDVMNEQQMIVCGVRDSAGRRKIWNFSYLFSHVAQCTHSKLRSWTPSLPAFPSVLLWPTAILILQDNGAAFT